jgi:hypothetical protein
MTFWIGVVIVAWIAWWRFIDAVLWESERGRSE